MQWTSNPWLPVAIGFFLAFFLSWLGSRIALRSSLNRLRLLEDDVSVLSERLTKIQKRSGGLASAAGREDHLEEARALLAAHKSQQPTLLKLPGRVN
jgi:hypothetical protein